VVDRQVVAAKLAELADRLARVRKHCPATPAELAADRDALDLVAFNLMLAVQSCLDLASHLIADEGWPPAADLAGTFVRLHEHGVLSPGLSTAMGSAARLRNLVAHLYGQIDVPRLHATVSHDLADLERFAAEVGSWVAGRG
jgi:uncharacterized protein YutE (UPF0331/DUF86 family)